MVFGLESFKTWFKGYDNQFVIIGGTACDLLMNAEGIDFRATKDIDMVLIVESLTADFGHRFWEYVKEGGYQHKSKSSGEGVYVRHGASSVNATEAAILKMIKETDGEEYEELRSLNQDLSFSCAEKEFSARDVSFGASQKKTLKLMTADEIFTNLGLLLSDQCVHTIKVAVFEGTTKKVFKDRREFTGSLLKQINETYGFIDLLNRTKAEIEGLYRVDRRDYPEEAVREALLNAIVHRDYSFSSSTLISAFDDRIEFVSIGGLVKGIALEDILMGISVARNENLANVFYRLELVEAYGTGMPKIMQSYEGFSQQPKIDISQNAFKITLPNINMDKLPGTFDKQFSDQEQKVMALFDKKPSIIRRDVEQALAVSQAVAVRVLKALVIKGVIQSVGGGKNTRYQML